jgi:lipopolysaccharide transport system ATP-binding protein
MSSTVISVENLSKSYQLGQINTGTFSNDLKVWWAKLRGQPNPLLRIGEADHGNRDGEELWALKDVSFTVEQGEVLGIIGRNGAGKSTLLKILSRVTAPTSGRVKVKGRIASLLEVGTGFHPELTGRENIYLNGAILGMQRTEIERKFDEIVDFAGVEKFIDTPVKRYSSGMYVRLAFAVAAHLDPEILVVDEVLAVGDAEFQKKCLGKMGEVAKEGRTVLFVSHNMVSINSLCSSCAWIKGGQLSALDFTSAVIQKFLQEYQPKSGNGELDLCNWVDRYGDGQARIRYVKMLGQDGLVSTEFFRTKQFAVEVEVENFADRELIFSAVLVNSIGENVLHLSQYDGPGSIVVNRKGFYKIIFTVVSLPLFSGNYKLIIGVHTTADHPVDVVSNFLSFVVSEPLDSPRPSMTQSSKFLCWAPSVWSGEYLGK